MKNPGALVREINVSVMKKAVMLLKQHPEMKREPTCRIQNIAQSEVLLEAAIMYEGIIDRMQLQARIQPARLQIAIDAALDAFEQNYELERVLRRQSARVAFFQSLNQKG